MYIHSQIFVCMHLIKFDLHKNNFKLIVYLTNEITQALYQQQYDSHCYVRRRKWKEWMMNGYTHTQTLHINTHDTNHKNKCAQTELKFQICVIV